MSVVTWCFVFIYVLGKASDADSEEGLPDSKAWGKRSGKYYNTDYVDKDFGGEFIIFIDNHLTVNAIL